MGIFILNNAADPFNALDYKLSDLYLGRGVWLRKLEGTITLPARLTGEFFFLYACANQDGSSPALLSALSSAARPARDVVKLIGAIGTKPSTSTELVVQQQNDNQVQFNGDYTYDVAIGEPGGFTDTSQNQRDRAGWPPGICAAVFFRMESWRIANADAAGLQLGQSNLHGVDGVHADPGGPPARGFRTQSKGLVRLNQGGEQSHDHLRVCIDPGNDRIWVQASTDCKGFLMLSGYELKANLQ